MQERPRGTIASCHEAQCAYRCCDFQQAGSIHLYPHELERATRAGQSVAHLEVLARDRHGGTRVRCRAEDRASCDGGYKPLDCVSYPLFPAPGGPHAPAERAPLEFVKGSECPLGAWHLRAHHDLISGLWQNLIAENPEVAAWLMALWHPNSVSDVERYDFNVTALLFGRQRPSGREAGRLAWLVRACND